MFVYMSRWVWWSIFAALGFPVLFGVSVSVISFDFLWLFVPSGNWCRAAKSPSASSLQSMGESPLYLCG